MIKQKISVSFLVIVLSVRKLASLKSTDVKICECEWQCTFARGLQPLSKIRNSKV